MKKMFFMIMCAVLFTQCFFLKDDDVLPNAVFYTGNQLKMNGYYHRFSKYSNSIDFPIIMYKNGILIYIENGKNSIEEMDKYIRNHSNKNKYVWGVFFINDDKIIINRLDSDYPHVGIVMEGVILNDTTFHITKYIFENKEREFDEVYHFREFYPKPDSTNNYIK